MRTNTREAKKNIGNFILNNCDPIGYGYDVTPEEVATVEGICKFLQDAFYSQILKNNIRYKEHRVSRFEMFEYWATGLSGCGLFDYYCYRSDYNAIDICKSLFNEDEVYARKFTEEEACLFLTKVIYNFIYKF